MLNMLKEEDRYADDTKKDELKRFLKITASLRQGHDGRHYAGLYNS